MACGSAESTENSLRGHKIYVGSVVGRELPGKAVCAPSYRVQERYRWDRSTSGVVPGLGST